MYSLMGTQSNINISLEVCVCTVERYMLDSFLPPMEVTRLFLCYLRHSLGNVPKNIQLNTLRHFK